MDIEKLIETIDNLPPEDQARIREHLAQPKPKHKRTFEEWKAIVDTAIDAFWGDSTPEEMQELAAAMSAKYIDPNAWKSDET